MLPDNFGVIILNDHNIILASGKEIKYYGAACAITDTENRLAFEPQAINRLIVENDQEKFNSRFWNLIDTKKDKQSCLAVFLAREHLRYLLDQYADQKMTWLLLSTFRSQLQYEIIAGICNQLSHTFLSIGPSSLFRLLSRSWTQSRIGVIEIELHQSSLNHFFNDTWLSWKTGKVFSDFGWIYFRDQIASSIGKSILEKSHFDPFYNLVTEQQLLSQIDVCLKDLREHKECTLQFSSIKGVAHQVVLRKEDLLADVYQIMDKLFSKLDNEKFDVLIIDKTYSLFPGWERYFKDKNQEVVVLSEHDVLSGAQCFLHALRTISKPASTKELITEVNLSILHSI